ncbi:MAG: hypothetical protein IPK82_11360 [Polyangiaceae bacterium]|nr:hypothetical protein [Polyangiaceae bacterium]
MKQRDVYAAAGERAPTSYGARRGYFVRRAGRYILAGVVAALQQLNPQQAAFAQSAAGSVPPDGARPTDAPHASAKAALPPVPPEYIEVEHDGIAFSYHPSARERIGELFDTAQSVRTELERRLGAPVLRNVLVRVTAVPAEMAHLSPGDVSAGTACAAFSEHGLVVLSAVPPPGAPPATLSQSLAHALAHLALDEATGQRAPAWFHEGFATFTASGAATRTRAMIEIGLLGRASSLAEIVSTQAEYGPHRHEAADLVRFVASSHTRAGEASLPMLARRLKEGVPFESALARAVDESSLAALEAKWRESRARRYAFLPVLITLAALVLAIVGAVKAVVRLRRGRAAAAAAARPRRKRAESAPKVVRGSPVVAAAGRAAAGRGNDAAIHVPRDPEVPKVEHNGTWHTLH